MFTLTNTLILDTETTGLDGQAEIVQLAIINLRGQILFNQLIKPKKQIPDDVIRIHKITNEMVVRAPLWTDVDLQVADIIRNKKIITYNAPFDLRMFRQSPSEHQVEWEKIAEWHCIMSGYRKTRQIAKGQWISLVEACEERGIRAKNSHSALGDCLMTLELMEKMYPLEIPLIAALEKGA